MGNSKEMLCDSCRPLRESVEGCTVCALLARADHPTENTNALRMRPELSPLDFSEQLDTALGTLLRVAQMWALRGSPQSGAYYDATIDATHAVVDHVGQQLHCIAKERDSLRVERELLEAQVRVLTAPEATP